MVDSEPRDSGREIGIDFMASVSFFKALAQHPNRDERGRVPVTRNEKMSEQMGVLAFALCETGGPDRQQIPWKKGERDPMPRPWLSADHLRKWYGKLEEGQTLMIEVDEIANFLKLADQAREIQLKVDRELYKHRKRLFESGPEHSGAYIE